MFQTILADSKAENLSQLAMSSHVLGAYIFLPLALTRVGQTSVHVLLLMGRCWTADRMPYLTC